MIATKKTSEYDQAVALLRDLRALAERQGEVETAAFQKRVLDLRAQYPTRPGLQNPPRRSGLSSLTSVKLSWVTLDRIVSKEALSDEAVRRQLEQNARPLRSHTASMGDEDLLAKLRGLGVDADREKLAKLCEGALSAEEVVGERLRLHGWDADWAWICLVTLWERWWPDKACLELLDDKVQAGYEADQRNDFVVSGRIWLDAWSDVLRLCNAVDALRSGSSTTASR